MAMHSKKGLSASQTRRTSRRVNDSVIGSHVARPAGRRGRRALGHGPHAVIHAGHGLCVFLRTPVLTVRAGSRPFQTPAQYIHMTGQTFHQRTQLAGSFLQALLTGGFRFLAADFRLAHRRRGAFALFKRILLATPARREHVAQIAHHMAERLSQHSHLIAGSDIQRAIKLSLGTASANATVLRNEAIR